MFLHCVSIFLCGSDKWRVYGYRAGGKRGRIRQWQQVQQDGQYLHSGFCGKQATPTEERVQLSSYKWLCYWHTDLGFTPPPHPFTLSHFPPSTHKSLCCGTIAKSRLGNKWHCGGQAEGSWVNLQSLADLLPAVRQKNLSTPATPSAWQTWINIQLWVMLTLPTS